MIGKVTGHEFKRNKDGSLTTVMLQVQITEDNDVQSVQLYTQAGDESIPPNGSTVVILALSESYKIAVAVDDNIEPTMGTGEKKLYSTSSGAIAAFINFLGTGVLELNGNSNFAVKFNELQAAFNSLQATVDNHVHSGVTTGPGTSGPLVTASTADIAPAKSTTVKL